MSIAKVPSVADRWPFGNRFPDHNPGITETLDLRDEGETCGFLERKQEFHPPGGACSVNQWSTHMIQSAERPRPHVRM